MLRDDKVVSIHQVNLIVFWPRPAFHVSIPSATLRVAERMNRSISEGITTVLSQSGLACIWWDDTAMHWLLEGFGCLHRRSHPSSPLSYSMVENPMYLRCTLLDASRTLFCKRIDALLSHLVPLCVISLAILLTTTGGGLGIHRRIRKLYLFFLGGKGGKCFMHRSVLRRRVWDSSTASRWA